MRQVEREKYRLHARMPVYRRHIERARQIVREALAAVPGQWAVGVSGGKDSIVTTQVCFDVGWRGPLFHYWSDEIPIENTAMVAALANRLGCEMIGERITGEFDFFAEQGRVLLFAETEEDRRALRAHDRRYRAQIEAHARRHGLAGIFWGMRMEESRARTITLRKLGALYRAQTRETWTCCPLAHWSGRDVWAYLIERDLPWLDVYDRADDRERERSETTWIFGLSGDVWLRGQGLRLRERDPALWSRLCERWPELRKLGG